MRSAGEIAFGRISCFRMKKIIGARGGLIVNSMHAKMAREQENHVMAQDPVHSEFTGHSKPYPGISGDEMKGWGTVAPPQLFHAKAREVMDSVIELKEKGMISNETFDFLMSVLVAKIAEFEVCRSLSDALGPNLLHDLFKVMGDKS